MIAVGFAVFIAILVFVLLWKWPPSTWKKATRRRKVRFDDNVAVYEIESGSEEEDDMERSSAPPPPPKPLDVVEEDQHLRDAQNQHALRLRGGKQTRGGAPTTGAFLFASHNTRLELNSRTESGANVPPETAHVIPA